MKLKIIHGSIYLILFAFHVSAAIFYVNVNNSVPLLPFNTWNTAATNIQDAIDASINGDLILVTNGIYQSGGKVMAGDLTNRVALNKSITVQSVNGPLVTSIIGVGATNGPASIRCAWLTNGASLIGFTLAGGATRTTGDLNNLLSGGGVWCASSNALISSCIIISNSASQNGGAVYQGTINSSLISSNGATFGSGAIYKSVLINCTVVSNPVAGIISPLAMTNCIIYFNGTIGNYVNASGNAFSHCCTTPALAGTANFTNAPQLFADGVHLSSNSPCISAGININAGADLFGNAWSNPPSVGCAEWTIIPIVTAPQIKLTGNPAGFTIGNFAVGSPSTCSFSWLKDGGLLQDDDHFSSTQTTNLVATGVRLSDAGNYQVIVSNVFGVVTSSVVKLTVHCVDAAGTNPVVPYSTWATAATNIQDAISVSAAGDAVLVTNGLYASGGKSMDGVITNRVSLDKAILVQSVNGASTTIIQGAWDPISTNGPNSIRCAWMTNNAILSGFTLGGGATRSVTSSPNQSMYAGGIWGSSNNAVAYGCTIVTNYASNTGGGAFGITLNNCTLNNNHAVGSGTAGSGVAGAGSGGGAANCNLNNCLVISNVASQGSGGGAQNCSLKNCALVGNNAGLYGSGAYEGRLLNCTVAGNLSTSITYSSYSGGVAYANLTNCIVYGNFNTGSGPTNYNNSCIFNYCDTDPLPAGAGNQDVNPLFLGDNFHLAATSPCIGAGTSNWLSGSDIDGQPWNNPPAVGCDEWHPTPIMAVQPSLQIGIPAHGLTFNVVAAGQAPFSYFWNKDGTPIQADGHFNNSGTPNLIVNNFGTDDAGQYQVVVSNTFGVVTSTVAPVVIHAVNIAGLNPIIPFSTWATAATNIQDAINIASPGDIVLVTNGLYATGGKVIAGDLNNRVALDRAITVMSVNGYVTTAIQGAWDPTTTNGPAAVRCAYLANGAVLNGFTLQNGATRAVGDAYGGGPLESGGGVWCNTTNGIVVNCVLSNNSAMFGGGISYGTLNNSLVLYNTATAGGGAYYAVLNNCTVVNNTAIQSHRGGGTCNGSTRNSIVANNYDNPIFLTIGNYDTAVDGAGQYFNSCTSPTIGLPGANNINANPQLLDLFHIAVTSPCRGTGNALYTGGTDLDGEVWMNPPAMGCDEVIVSNLVGPLLVNIYSFQTNVLVNRPASFSGTYTGRATAIQWLSSDGLMITNNNAIILSHIWTNAGDYTVTFTVYNNDNPGGVSTNAIVHVQPLDVPQLTSTTWLTNGFQFQFTAQTNANYTIQYTTNLASPIMWQTLQTIYYSTGGVIQINDPALANAARFYRILAQ